MKIINTTVTEIFLFSLFKHIDMIVTGSIGAVTMVTIVVAVVTMVTIVVSAIVTMVTIVVAVVREVVASSGNTVESGSSCSSSDMFSNVVHLSLAVVIGVRGSVTIMAEKRISNGQMKL